MIIGVGGAHSSVGKTTVASSLLKYFTSESREDILATRLGALKRWGAIKYTKTAFYSSLVDDKAMLHMEGKDTALLYGAGAEEVLWVQSPPEDLAEVLPLAVERLSHLDAIVVEGNSAIEFLKPDIVLFILSASNKVKTSAQGILHQADIIIIPGDHDSNGGHEGVTACTVSFTPSDKKALRELVQCMEMTIQKKSIKELLEERSVEGRISCPLARAIAEELGVPYKEVGDAADAMGIKIKNCELGCF